MNKYIRLISIGILFSLSSVTVFSSDSYRHDSLEYVISASKNPADVMNALELLSRFHFQQPEELPILRKLLNEAIRVDSINTAYKTISYLIRYHYNNNEKDSLVHLAHLTDSLSNVKKEVPDVYYTLYSCICKIDLYTGAYELAVNEALRLYDQAQSQKHQFGIICSSETLGSIYLVSQRDSDAVYFLEQALNGLEAINGEVYYRVRIYSSLIESCLRLNRLDEVSALLVRMEKAMIESDEQETQNNMTRKYKYYLWQMKAFYVDLYLKQNQIDKAKKALETASAYVNGATLFEHSNYQLCYYFLAKARFYKKTKDYPTALATIDSILKYSNEPEELKLKAELLCDQGNFKDAAVLYKQIMQQADQKKDEASLRQLNHLRVLYEVNEKERQTKELNINTLKVKTKQHQLWLSMFTCLILLFILYILYKLLKRTQRLKNELLLEKNSLIKSKKKLSHEKIKAEEANRMKSAFIANISHEIRTPLNAIVGFSSLLADPSFEKESKEEFVNIINLNSDLLLNLINDVLDISRMEAGNTRFEIKSCEVVACCREALSSVEYRVAKDVKLTLTTPHNSSIQQTDPLRLQQLLLNLLSNAAKFTQKGEINLSFETDETLHQMRFIVTDTGTGIPLEKQELIFERFMKLDEYVQGTGLGLAICRTIAERLGGSVFIDPTYTDGARFIFIHPTIDNATFTAVHS